MFKNTRAKLRQYVEDHLRGAFTHASRLRWGFNHIKHAWEYTQVKKAGEYKEACSEGAF